MSTSEVKVVDLFCGPGGASIGFNEYFDIPLAVDLDFDACKTYLNNLGSAVRRKDVLNLSGCYHDFDGITAIISGPPCQPFSEINMNKDPDDPRIDLWKGVMDYAESIDPAFIVIENVPTVFAYVKEAIIDRAKSLGYYVTTVIVNAADYSVAQARKRWFCIATKKPFEFPQPTCLDHRTVADAIRNIPEELNKGHSKPKQETIERFKGIPQGKWVSLTPGGFKNTIWLEWNKPSPTIVNLSKVRMIHPNGKRLITETEALALQDFPIDYDIFGDKRSRCQQIANTIPPSLMRPLAHDLAVTQFDEVFA